MSPESFVIFAIIGAVTGFFSGLLGVGGGTIVTPLLITMLAGIFPSEMVTHAAIATSLAVIFFTSAPGAVSHARRGAVDWKVAGLITAGACGGSTVAALTAREIPGTALNLLLSAFLLRTAYSMFRPMRAAKFFRVFAADKFLPAAGAIIGVLSALLGIGGGVLSSPFLAARKMPIKTAIATWAVFNNPLALFASAGYIIASIHAEPAGLPQHTIGYVYLPALLGITAFSMLFAVVGARQTAKLSDQLLRRLFGGIVGVLAVRLLIITFSG
ncbi:MAG: sulfite exporter TauE/SafE family protein [Betaproteobacteria bacterium]|nr:sulfite exporter TauE/SafE family protein [Betaproteobacteria bacterium]